VPKKVLSYPRQPRFDLKNGDDDHKNSAKTGTANKSNNKQNTQTIKILVNY
jgi:hypothetical protein